VVVDPPEDAAGDEERPPSADELRLAPTPAGSGSAWRPEPSARNDDGEKEDGNPTGGDGGAGSSAGRARKISP
jgi:hypothetical protein